MFTPQHILPAQFGKTKAASRSRSQAFTLLELLVVIGIIVVLAALVGPALDVLRSGNAVTQAAAELSGKLDLARQLAMSENERVELRIFKAPDADGGGNAEVYRILGIYRTADGAAIESPKYLPKGVEITTNTAFSALVSPDNKLEGTEANVGGLQNIPYKAILFRPDGSTHLSPDGPGANEPLWTLTVIRSVDAALSASELPDNFATVVCDPVTGRSSLYRP